MSNIDQARGFGGKFGIEEDRMDKSAVGHDYQVFDEFTMESQFNVVISHFGDIHAKQFFLNRPIYLGQKLQF